MRLYGELWLSLFLVGIPFLLNSPTTIQKLEIEAEQPAAFSQAAPAAELVPSAGPQLRDYLEKLRDQTRIQPINARVDSVWKAIPGLNGLELDVDKTYQAAVHSQQKPITLFYKQIPPKISLSDLPPNPIYRGNPEKKQIALMVNVAWGEEYLPSMMATLKKAGANATFFLDGSWVTRNPLEAKKIADAGFEIGNHAFHHPDMAKLGEARQTDEIASTNRAIKEATGLTPQLFAPPSGSFNPLTVRIAANQGMKTILWTADTIDWQRPSPSTIINRITTKAAGGVLVLMHPTAPTAQALPELIRQLQNKGFEIVSVSQLLDQTRTPPK